MSEPGNPDQPGNSSEPGNPDQPAQTLTDVLFRGGWKQHKGRFLGVAAVIIVVGLFSTFGTQFLLRSADQAATASSGAVYSGTGYTVSFPGKPTVKDTTDQATGLPERLVKWSNKQKLYEVLELSQIGEGVTAEDVVNSAVASSGAELIDSQEVTVSGGTAIAAHTKAQDVDMWIVTAISDDRSSGAMLLQTGDARDDAFFDSLQLAPTS